MNQITDFSQMTDAAVKKLFAEAPKIPIDDLKKVGITTSTGLTYYDLQAPAKNLFPVITPLRNIIPRVAGNGGPATNWVAVTNINSANLHGFVPEGRRNGVLSVTATPKSATYKRAGLEQTVTKEAELAGQNFEDVRATSAQRELWATMIEEELQDIGTNGSAIALGNPAGLAQTTASTGGSIGAGTYKAQVVELTYFGDRDSSLAGGVATQASITNPNNFTFTVNLGSSNTSNQVTTSVLSGGTNLINLSIPYHNGVVGWAWYVDNGAGGALTLQAITHINSIQLLSLTTSGQNITAITADNSKNTLGYDGLLYQGFASGSGTYIQAMATGVAGTGTVLTPSGFGTINEIDTMVQSLYDNYRLVPTVGYASSQEIINIAKKLLTRAQTTTQVTGVQYFSELEGGEFVLNVGVSQIRYQSLLGQPFSIKVHPYMPKGTMLFLTEVLPYPINNVPNVFEMKLRRDYYQVAWPLREETYEFGVYFDGVLAHYFPPSMAIITNIPNG